MLATRLSPPIPWADEALTAPDGERPAGARCRCGSPYVVGCDVYGLACDLCFEAAPDPEPLQAAS